MIYLRMIMNFPCRLADGSGPRCPRRGMRTPHLVVGLQDDRDKSERVDLEVVDEPMLTPLAAIPSRVAVIGRIPSSGCSRRPTPRRGRVLGCSRLR